MAVAQQVYKKENIETLQRRDTKLVQRGLREDRINKIHVKTIQVINAIRSSYRFI